ncbi:MAG: nuclear transport factor 2 family protein [Acidimicrobiia bacterium]|nr:nuclear transport factor 2 family protein [Acidimicrobiia bacterium]
MSAEDELAVRNLVARVAQYADGPDVDAYVALFTADAVWDMPGAPRRGLDEIRAGSEERRAAGTIGPSSNTRHVVSTIAVTIDGDQAVADSVWQFYADTASAPRLQLMGTYRDQCVRTDGKWKLAHRTITFG